jgi:SAM-dependent methyltransferase
MIYDDPTGVSKKELLLKNIDRPRTRSSIVIEACRGKDVLDLGCVNHDAKNARRDTWLHKCIVDVAKHVVGVDYLNDDVEKLRNEGYDVIQGDVTKPLGINQTFDVIVIGNLIEHLSNFEGLFNNIQSLLKIDGVVIISTANPFYQEQYFFSALKGYIIVNPEHTCWIDPLNLSHLSSRFKFKVKNVYWIKECWRLREVILVGNGRDFDICRGQWSFSRPPGMVESAFSWIVMPIMLAILPRESALRIKIDSDRDYYRRVVWIHFASRLFGWLWAGWKFVIPSSKINTYELYVALLGRY